MKLNAFRISFIFHQMILVSFLTFCRRRAHTQPSNRSFRQRIQQKTHVFIENVVKVNRSKVTISLILNSHQILNSFLLFKLMTKVTYHF